MLGLSSLYVGVVNFYFGAEVLQQFYQLDISEFSENNRNIISLQIRILSGFWLAGGLYAFYLLPRVEENKSIIRLILFGFAASALGELYSVFLQQGDIVSGLIKATMQMGFCVLMEFWRYYIVTKLPTKIIRQ